MNCHKFYHLKKRISLLLASPPTSLGRVSADQFPVPEISWREPRRGLPGGSDLHDPDSHDFGD